MYVLVRSFYALTYIHLINIAVTGVTLTCVPVGLINQCNATWLVSYSVLLIFACIHKFMIMYVRTYVSIQHRKTCLKMHADDTYAYSNCKIQLKIELSYTATYIFSISSSLTI